MELKNLYMLLAIGILAIAIFAIELIPMPTQISQDGGEAPVIRAGSRFNNMATTGLMVLNNMATTSINVVE